MRRPKSISEKTEVKGSFRALRYIPRFFNEIWQINPLLFLANILLRLVHAFIPVAMLWVGKLIIDEVVLQISLESKDLNNLWTYVGVEFGLALLSDLLNRGYCIN